jgi:comEA protein
MKNRISLCLLVVTLVFLSGLAGFYIGRNTNRGNVDIEILKPAVTATVPSETGATEATLPGKVNINTALKEELVTLPGIGETLAERIIAYREENGPFQKTEELLNVNGIGEQKWEAIRDLVCV